MPTLAKGTGLAVSLSTIVPEMVMKVVCEKTGVLTQKRMQILYKNRIPFE
jgi:hypothetical protein